MEIKNLISISLVAVFMISLLFSKNTRRTYILTIVYMIPFIDLLITKVSFGGFTVFEAITFYSFFLTLNQFKFKMSNNSIYVTLSFTLLFMLIIGGLNSEFVSSSFLSLAKLMAVFIYAKFLVDECLKDGNFVNIVLNALRTVCIFSVIFVILQLIFGLKFSFYPSVYMNPNAEMDVGIRYPSFFLDPQKYAQFLSMLSFLFLLKVPNNLLFNRYRYLLFLILIFTLFATGGRAALIGLVVGLGFVSLFGEVRFRIFGLIFCFLALIGYYYFSPNFVVFNREQTVDESFQFRYKLWMDAIDIFLKHPILGIGIGNYQDYVSIHAQHQYWILNDDYMYMDHPESGYLKLLTEYGIFGFIIVLMLLFRPVYKALAQFLRRQIHLESLFISAGLISFLISFFTVYSLSDRRVLIVVVSFVSLLVILEKVDLNKVNSIGRE